MIIKKPLMSCLISYLNQLRPRRAVSYLTCPIGFGTKDNTNRPSIDPVPDIPGVFLHRLNFSLSAKRALNARSLPDARCFKNCLQRLGVALQYLLLAVLSNVGVKDIFGSEYFRIYKIM